MHGRCLATAMVVAFCAILAPAVADSEVLPVKGMAGMRSYDLATGRQSAISNPHRGAGTPIWAATSPSGFFWAGQRCDYIALDWGDILTPATVGSFSIAYSTNADPGFECIITFYDNENGRNTQPKATNFIAACRITGLAGTITPADRELFWGWTYCVNLTTPLTIAAGDLDGDSLGDWGYTYWFSCVNYTGAPGSSACAPSACGAVGYGVPNMWKAGPLIAGEPNVDPLAWGIEDGFDVFNDPNYVRAPGYVDPNLTHICGPALVRRLLLCAVLYGTVSSGLSEPRHCGPLLSG